MHCRTNCQWKRAGAEEQRPGLLGTFPVGPFRVSPVSRESAISPPSSTPHPLVVKGGARYILMKEADMAIHSSPGSLNAVRQPKPRKGYAVPRFRVTLVRDNRAVPPPCPMRDSASAAALLRPLFAGLDREQFLVCGLDARHCIIGANIVSVGSLTLSIVHPREVFKPLILMNAAAWICAHNHPSDDPAPSEEDRQLTIRLKQGADLLGIPLLDHLVLADGRCYSFADHGWPGA